MFDDDPVGTALRNAHPAADAEIAWPTVLRRIKRRRHVQRSVLSICVLVAIGAIVGVIAARDDTSRTITVSDVPSSTRRVDDAATAPAGERPSFVTVGSGSVWVLTTTVGEHGMPGDRGTLVRVDPESGTVRATIALQGAPIRVAVDESSAWVSLFTESAVARIDLASNTVVATIPLRLPRPVCDNNCVGPTDFLPVHIAANDETVWVSTARGYVARIDKRTNSVAATIETTPNATQGRFLAATPAAVLVAQNDLVRIDNAANTITTLARAIDPALRVGGDGLIEDVYTSPAHPELGAWFTVGDADSPLSDPIGIMGINPETGRSIGALAESGIRMVAVTDRVWARRPGELFAFDPATGKVGSKIPMIDDAIVALDPDKAWWVRPGSNLLVGTSLRDLNEQRTVVSAAAPATTAPPTTAAQTTLAPADFTTLLDRKFVTRSISATGQPSSLVFDTTVTVQFQRGNPGYGVAWTACNMAGGTLVFDGDRLVVTFVSTTLVGCPPNRAAQDSWLTEFFLDRPAWRPNGEGLVLTNAKGRIELVPA
jgi:hypothetical protein